MSTPNAATPPDTWAMRLVFIDRAPDCSRCGQPIIPGFVAVVDGLAETIVHEICPPWKPHVVDGEGETARRPSIPLLSIVDDLARPC